MKNSAFRLSSLLIAISVMVSTPALAVSQMPQLNIPSVMTLKQALPLIKNQMSLESYANLYDRSEKDLVKMAADLTVMVDKKGAIFFKDSNHTAIDLAANADLVYDDSIPTSRAFELESNPGATQVLYLDFLGHTASFTSWNSSYEMEPIVASSFSLDGVHGTFNEAEKQAIIGVWKQVAEDYANFNVNVTTKYPGEDKLYSGDGMRVVITKNWTKNSPKGDCKCGGFAYLNSWNNTSSTNKPAYVFYDMLGNSVKNIGEAASHEAGHSLNLGHMGSTQSGAYYSGHGSGNHSWAPIMGTGYTKRIVQWTNGSYAGSNNTEDEIARMISSGGIGLKETLAETPKTANSGTVSFAPGGSTTKLQATIASSTDVDLFKIPVGAGNLGLNVSTFSASPNLKIGLELINHLGEVVAQSGESGDVSASLNYFVNKDRVLYARVKGVGFKTFAENGFSNYGSIGSYVFQASGFPVVGGSEPMAVISKSTTDTNVGEPVNFSAAASTDSNGSIDEYVWNMGDGQTVLGQLVNYTYFVPGNYTVTLTVVDNDGFSSTASTTVRASVYRERAVNMFR